MLPVLFVCAQDAHEIKKDELIEAIRYGKPLEYKDCRIKFDIDLLEIVEAERESATIKRAYVNSQFIFENCIFEGAVIASKKDKIERTAVQFMKSISFNKCQFTSEVNLDFCIVDGAASFTDCEFFSEFKCNEVAFRGSSAQFSNSVFSKKAGFAGATFFDKASFMWCKFKDNAFFSHTRFDDDATFRACTFSGIARFSSMLVKGDCFFNQSIFEGNSVFKNISIYRRAEFANCMFKGDAEFKNARFFDRTNFNKLTVAKQMTVEKSHFLMGAPEFADLNKEAGASVLVTDCYFVPLQEWKPNL